MFGQNLFGSLFEKNLYNSIDSSVANSVAAERLVKCLLEKKSYKARQQLLEKAVLSKNKFLILNSAKLLCEHINDLNSKLERIRQELTKFLETVPRTIVEEKLSEYIKKYCENEFYQPDDYEYNIPYEKLKYFCILCTQAAHFTKLARHTDEVRDEFYVALGDILLEGALEPPHAYCTLL